jgi:anti-sigma B factor antagonist
MQLRISDRDVQGVIALDLSGRIVAGEECDALRAKIKELLSNKQARLLLNMGEVTRIDSTGIGMLVEAAINTARQGGHLKLVKLPRLIYNVLYTHRLVQAFEIHTSEEEALASLEKAPSNPAAARP